MFHSFSFVLVPKMRWCDFFFCCCRFIWSERTIVLCVRYECESSLLLMFLLLSSSLVRLLLHSFVFLELCHSVCCCRLCVRLPHWVKHLHCYCCCSFHSHACLIVLSMRFNSFFFFLSIQYNIISISFIYLFRFHFNNLLICCTFRSNNLIICTVSIGVSTRSFVRVMVHCVVHSFISLFYTQSNDSLNGSFFFCVF